MGKKGLLPFSFMNKEFLHTKDGRAIRILAEFLEPEYRFREFGVDDTIVFFGSARILPRKVAKTNLKKLTITFLPTLLTIPCHQLCLLTKTA